MGGAGQHTVPDRHGVTLSQVASVPSNGPDELGAALDGLPGELKSDGHVTGAREAAQESKPSASYVSSLHTDAGNVQPPVLRTVVPKVAALPSAPDVSDPYAKLLSYGTVWRRMDMALTSFDAVLSRFPQKLREQAAELLVCVLPDEKRDTGPEHIGAVRALRDALNDCTVKGHDPAPLLAYLNNQVLRPEDIRVYTDVYTCGGRVPSLPLRYAYGGIDLKDVWNNLLAGADDAGGAIRRSLEFLAAQDGNVMAALERRTAKYGKDPRLFAYETTGLAGYEQQVLHRLGRIPAEVRQGLSVLAKLPGPRDYTTAFIYAAKEGRMPVRKSVQCLAEIGKAGNSRAAESVLRKYNI